MNEMSEQLLNSKSDAMVEVEEQMSELTVDDTDAIVKIMEDVEINLLQEKIAQLKKEKSLINTLSEKKMKVVSICFFSVAAVMVVVLPTLVQAISEYTSNMALPILSGHLLIAAFLAVFLIAGSKATNGFTENDEEKEAIVLKRKELFEKSLKVQIVHKDEAIIDEKWREIMAFDENEDYVKFLTRIVENESGYETIEAKRLKS